MSRTSVSGLDQVAGTAMLHQPHQARTVDAPGDRFALVLPFDTNFDFDRNNRVFLPPLEMVVEDAYVELEVEPLTVTNVVPTTTAIQWPNTQSWLGEGGAQLLYKAQSLYTMTEPEALVSQYVNTENQMQLNRRLDIVEDADFATDFGDALAGVSLKYISLRPIIEKILGNAGPLNAYAANSWSIDIRLRALLDIIHANVKITSIGSSQPAKIIKQARLVLVGHREDAANAMKVSESLAKDGVKVCFNQSNHLSTSVGTSTAAVNTATVVLSDLEGEATDIWNILRIRSSAANFLKTTNARNPQGWATFDSPSDLLSIGTSSNPTRVYGQPLPIKTLRKILQGVAYEGASVLSKYRKATAKSLFERVDTGIIFSSLAEAGSMGQKFGTYSGSIRLKNDFRETFMFSVAQTDLLIDTVIYIRRVLVLTHAGIIMVNEE